MSFKSASVSAVLLAAAVPFLPTTWLLAKGLPAADDAINPASEARPAGTSYEVFEGYTIRTLHKDRDFPLVISPVADATISFPGVESCEGDALAVGSPTALRCLVKANEQWFRDARERHGGLLFRGFELTDAMHFEESFVQLAHPAKPFDGVYLGTSPRTEGVNGTRYVSTASNIPGWQHIMPHLEMSFRKTPPDLISFWVHTAPASGAGGESPLSDFRQMWRDMKPEIRSAFEERGIQYHRKYYSVKTGKPFPFGNHPSYSKNWQAMFRTEDKAEAERQAAEQGFAFSWGKDDMLTLRHNMTAARPHPVTGELLWDNHLSVVHLSSWARGFAAAAHRSKSLVWRAQNLALWTVLRLAELIGTNPMLVGEDGDATGLLGGHVTYGDGGEIPEEHIDHVYALMWRHTVIEPWQNGDLCVLDNHRIAHGRTPFKGPRSVLVSWVE